MCQKLDNSAPFFILLPQVPDPNWQGLAGKSMEHDQKLTVGSPTRCRTYLPLVALLALWLPTSSSEATFKSPDALRVASAQSGPTHLVAAKSRQRSARVTTVNNLRVSQKANQHRLVVDLARRFTYTQQRLADPDRLVINLRNAVLSRTAKHKIDDDSFPIEVEVAQVSPRKVRVVLDMENITTVKLRKLIRPHRLVMDYIAQSENRLTPTLQPKVTLPPVSRQITPDERLARLGIASDRRAMEVAARENGDNIDHARDFLDMIKADLALSKRIEESQNLAWETKLAVVNHVGAHYSLEDLGVKTAPFYVLRYTAMPSILVELAFISNPIEERRLRQPDFREKVAEGLFEGIRNYLNSVQVALAR